MNIARVGLNTREKRCGRLADPVAGNSLAGGHFAADVIAAFGRDISRGRLLVAAASDGVVSGQVLHLAEGFLIAGVRLADQRPKLDGLHEVAALFQEPGQPAVDRHVGWVLLARLQQQPDAHVQKAEHVGSLGHVQLDLGIPGILR